LLYNKGATDISLLSANDILTGLLTWAAFEDEFKAFMSSAVETGQPVSLVFLDIDNFLKINEVQGHDGGDKVMMTVAEILRMKSFVKQIRPSFEKKYGSQQHPPGLRRKDGAENFPFYIDTVGKALYPC